MNARRYAERIMDWKPEEEDLIRRYLLDDASDEERRRVEARLLEDDDYGEWLLLIEDELIDDYACRALPAGERELFERNFLLTPRRRQDLIIAQEMTGYAPANPTAAGAMMGLEIRMTVESQSIDETTNQAPTRAMRRERSWWRTLFVPGWKIAAYTLVVLGLVTVIWLGRAGSDIERGMSALNQAYGKRRPIEARISGFGYAYFPRGSSQRGEADRGSGETEKEQIDYVALERAKVHLFGKQTDGNSAAALHAFGRYFLTQREFDKAIEYLRQALRLAPDSAQLHSDLGAALLSKIEAERGAQAERRNEDVNECFTHLNRALTLAPTLHEALFNRALLNQRVRLRREARADWEQYLQQDSQSPWAKEARSNLDQVEAELRNVNQRKEQLRQEFKTALAARDDSRVLRSFYLSYSLDGNSIVEKLLDDLLTARSAGRRESVEEQLWALAYVGQLSEEKTGDRFTADLAYFYRNARPEQLDLSARARKLMSDAAVFNSKAENDCALELYEQAREMFAWAGNTGEELFAQARIGHCHHQRSDTTRNLQAFLALIPVCERKKYRWMLSNALCGLANGYNASGQFSQAIAVGKRCGQISSELGDQIGALRSQYMLSYFYYELGKHEENLRITEQGVRLADEIAAEIRYAITFFNLRAWSLSAQGQHAAALAYQSEAVRMAEESKILRLIAYAHIYQGLVYARQQRFDEAIASMRHGITIGRQLSPETTGQDFVHNGLRYLGHVYRAAGNLPAAQDCFDQALKFYEHSKKQSHFYVAAKGRLLTLIAQGRNAEAREELERVLGLYEENRASISEESNRNSFFDQEQNIYDIAVDFAYTRLHNPEQAYTYAELSRSRSLLDMLHRGGVNVTASEAPDIVIEAHERPRGASQIRRQLPEHVQLLEYAVLEDKVIAWIISRSSVEREVFTLSQARLNALVDEFLAHLRKRPSGADQTWRESAMALHDQLIKPVEKRLDGRKQICIIPDKALIHLPFGALISRESRRLLIMDYALSYASSANIFLELTARARQKGSSEPERLLGVGNPHFDKASFPQLEYLREAETEVAGIAAFYATPELLLGERATKSAVLRGLRRADVAHFALHYVPDPWSPMRSRVPLAASQGDTQAGALRLEELYQLSSLPSLRLRVVVLAACQTRNEDVYAGEGAIGITRPFEAAGVPLIVASLWLVDDKAAADLMIAFHRARKRAGRSTVAALREAQLALSQGGDVYSHPYYWAAFVVLGGYSAY
jgi:CHAT domain-containing protein